MKKTMKEKTGYRWLSSFREKLHTIVFEADTFAGKLFDIILLLSIVISLLVVMLESVHAIALQYGVLLTVIEWVFTILFTVEYLLRLISVKRPLKYMFSFFGVIDFLAILPTYLTIFFVQSHYLLVVRSLRLLRIFRVLKLARYISEAQSFLSALKRARPKILVFLSAVTTIVIIMGTIMYQIEGAENGFTSIPRSIYWAIVTLTTVGYGDIAPRTILGQFVASIVMILGYAIIAVPTGIITSEFAQSKPVSTQACPSCSKEGHEVDAIYCKFCGARM